MVDLVNYILNLQTRVSENVNMKVIDVLIEVPCFKCLFAEPLRESHLHCDPTKCEKLTEWLLMQVEHDEKNKETISLEIVHTETPE